MLKLHYLYIWTLLFIPINAYSLKRIECDVLLEKGIAAMWKGEHVKSLELLSRVEQAALENKWYPQLFKALNNKGGNFYMMLDYGEALNNYLEGYKIAVKHLDRSYEMIVLNNIGILYSVQNQLLKAKSYFEKAYQIAKEVDDTIKTGYYAINLGSINNQLRRPAAARVYLQLAIKNLKNHPVNFLLAQIALAENDRLSGQLGRARTNAKNILEKRTNALTKDSKIALIVTISKTYLQEDHADKALLWLLKAQAINPDLKKKTEIFRLMADVYIMKSSFKTALAFKDSLIASKERLNTLNNASLFESSAVRLQLERYNKALSEKNNEIRSERRSWLLGVGGISGVLIIVIIAYKVVLNRNKQISKLAFQGQEIIELKIQAQTKENQLIKEREQNALLKQKQLENEIELQNQKLSARALYVSERDYMLKDILKELSKIPDLSKKKSLLNQIRILKSHLTVEKDWDSFIAHFEKVNQGFLKRLTDKHPNLTPNDIRYISYVYMNLTAKEIATVLNISPEALRKRKERVVQRLELEHGVTINTYLSTL